MAAPSFPEYNQFAGALERISGAGGVFFTFFLEKLHWERCAAAAARAGVRFVASGGFEDAERRVACAAGDDGAPSFPICCLSLTWPRGAKAPAHRDILGALLAQGIERHCVGDIRVTEGAAFVALYDKVAPFVRDTLTQAGGAHVSAAICAFPDIERQEGVMARINCASLRLDAVLQAALHLPRAKAQAVIREGRVRVDFADETRPDVRLSPGMTVSVRGFGRVRINEITGESKKGRLFADVEIFS